ncbi:unnamed protein product [Lactuca saligna]|uniref:Uncharacterized protein n=1 Tax=Lactuca saligna TaxID=75948 RepID=A0AA36E980_LACSI|nr:unnamed protein product [Lactuca saligna]
MMVSCCNIGNGKIRRVKKAFGFGFSFADDAIKRASISRSSKNQRPPILMNQYTTAVITSPIPPPLRRVAFESHTMEPKPPAKASPSVTACEKHALAHMMHHHQQKSSSSPPLETLVAPPVQTIASPSNENNLHKTLAVMNILDLCIR